MRTIRLEGTELTVRASAMDALAQALDLPEWWGRNLDALHDCLTDLGRPIRLEIADREGMEESSFGQMLLRVLEDVAKGNPMLELGEAD